MRLRFAGTLVVLFAGLAGCHSGLRGPGFKDNDLAEFGRRMRPRNAATTDSWGFTNKAREIERDLGVE